MLSVSHITGVTPRSEKNITMFKAASNIGHKVCRPGDLAINTMWAWMAALGFSNHLGVISPAYAVYRQQKPERLLSSYGDLLLRTETYKANYLSRSTGIRASRLRLYPEQFLRIPILVPPKSEQEAIVHQLEGETRTLDAGIDRASREIKFMQEFRTRLTADIVTGKLDVREAAKDLPDLSETVETASEADMPGDEFLEESELEEVNE
jgi:type I restriction enzyme, S subunit